MDVFSRTFSLAAADAGLAEATVSRHLPIFQRCVDPDDATALVARVRPASVAQSGDFLLLLTRRRLVVTRETKVLHRLRLHLNANLRHLSHVTWSTDERDSTTEICATAVDGVRECFRMRAPDVTHLDAVLNQVFADRHCSVSLAA